MAPVKVWQALCQIVSTFSLKVLLWDYRLRREEIHRIPDWTWKLYMWQLILLLKKYLAICGEDVRLGELCLALPWGVPHKWIMGALRERRCRKKLVEDDYVCFFSLLGWIKVKAYYPLARPFTNLFKIITHFNSRLLFTRNYIKSSVLLTKQLSN